MFTGQIYMLCLLVNFKGRVYRSSLHLDGCSLRVEFTCCVSCLLVDFTVKFSKRIYRSNLSVELVNCVYRSSLQIKFTSLFTGRVYGSILQEECMGRVF